MKFLWKLFPRFSRGLQKNKNTLFKTDSCTESPVFCTGLRPIAESSRDQLALKGNHHHPTAEMSWGKSQSKKADITYKNGREQPELDLALSPTSWQGAQFIFYTCTCEKQKSKVKKTHKPILLKRLAAHLVNSYWTMLKIQLSNCLHLSELQAVAVLDKTCRCSGQTQEVAFYSCFQICLVSKSEEKKKFRFMTSGSLQLRPPLSST